MEGQALVLASPLYGKAKVKCVSAIAGTNIDGVGISYDGNTTTAGAGGTAVNDSVTPGSTVTVTCTVPTSSTSGSITYYNGSTPSDGNYYYNATTTYTFDGWVGNGVANSNNVNYSFEMPTDDVSVTASSTVSYGKANQIYAIGLTVSNQSTSYLTNVSINGSSYTSSGTIYRWPNQGNITIAATPKAAETLGPYYTDNNSTPRANAYRWYVQRTYSMGSVAGSDGTNSTTVNPSVAATYSVYGTYNDQTVSKVSATSYTYDAGTYSRTSESTMYSIRINTITYYYDTHSSVTSYRIATSITFFATYYTTTYNMGPSNITVTTKTTVSNITCGVTITDVLKTIQSTSSSNKKTSKNSTNSTKTRVMSTNNSKLTHWMKTTSTITKTYKDNGTRWNWT